MKIHFKVNGVPAEVEASPDEMLLEVLRRDLDLRSVRATCGVGICGACTALVNGEPISTCIFLAPLAEGCEITTAEGLGGDHPVQRAFEEEHAFQCGYCTPGMSNRSIFQRHSARSLGIYERLLERPRTGGSR